LQNSVLSGSEEEGEKEGDSDLRAYCTVLGTFSTVATGGSVISPFYQEVSMNSSELIRSTYLIQIIHSLAVSTFPFSNGRILYSGRFATAVEAS
jgi:amino acid permease